MRGAPFFVIFCAGLLSYSPGSGQEIRGKILDEKGLSIPGATVSFKNKMTRVTTNTDGHFRIIATVLPDTLEFSAVGFEPYHVLVTEKTIKDPAFEVVLLASRSELESVVVTGYGAASLESFVSGRTPGLAVTDPKKARVLLRGASSVAGYSPAPKKGFSGFYSLDGSIRRKTYFADSAKLVEETITRSRLLTAGEVNDFRKWKMWEDYSQNEFSQFSKQWQLFPTHRYLVQLQNADHRGIVGQPVYLLDRSTADTVWKAVTDNTGKAELWAGFMGMEAKKYYIAVRDHQNTIVASEFKDGINKLQLEKVCSVPNKVEIAFVVDATGSMGDEIEYLKVELEDVIRSTFEKYNDLDLKLGSVFYRDTKDEYLTKHINFQPDLLKVLNFVKLQSAGGGGDMPEAVDVALQTALDSLKWSQDARAKILFLVLDAPPHADVANRMLHLIVKASAMGVRIVPIACSGTDKNTEFLMRSMALATNGTYLFLTDNSGIGGTHIKPTTDAFDVELLNDLLRRTIEQMVFVQPCAPGGGIEVPIKPFENISKIQLYPNPTNGKLTIENSKGLKEIYVTDFTGKILIRIAASPKIKKYQLDLSTYPSGGYFIRYITEDNTWGAEKVIVAR